MLINTVILFLRDALPIFVISTILISMLQQQGIKQRWYYLAVFTSVILSLVLLNTIDDISHALDDTGREWLYACLYIVCYFIALLLLGQLSMAKKLLADRSIGIIRLCAIALVVTIMTLNGANFLIYITGYWHQNNASNVLVTGVILGVGICASIAVLLYFLLAFIERYYRMIRETLLIFFSVGLLIKATNLLIQIDALPESRFLWDSNDLITENLELGQLLTVFIGYDATPTLLQLLLYIMAIVIAFASIFVSSAFARSTRVIANHKEAL
jgi:high-affinity iron transporter